MNKITDIAKKLDSGDLLFIADSLINPKTGKTYSYSTIQKVFAGDRNNERIVSYAKLIIKSKERLREAGKRS